MLPALAAIGEATQRYLAQRWPQRKNFKITDVHQIPGGASRETYRLRAEFVEDGIATQRGFILRRDPPSSLIDTDRSWEFRTYAAVYPTAVPVPEPLILEEDPGELLRPFSITAEIPGCESSIAMFNA